MTLIFMSLRTLSGKGHWEAVGRGWSSKTIPGGFGSQLGQKVNTVGHIIDTSLLSLSNGCPPSFLPPGGIPLWATATLHLRHFVGLACTSLGVHSPQTAWGRRDRAATDVSSWENVACHARLPMPFRPQSWPCFPNKAESQDIFLCVLMPSTLCSLPSDSRYQ